MLVGGLVSPCIHFKELEVYGPFTVYLSTNKFKKVPNYCQVSNLHIKIIYIYMFNEIKKLFYWNFSTATNHLK